MFATPDGNLEAREYLRPVRTRSEGGWKPVDTELARTSQGGVAPKATTVGLTFSGGGSTPLVRMQKAGRELALSWPGQLPVPVLEGAIATYPEVLPEVDLRMGAQEDGFTQLLVVKSAKAAASPQLAELRLKLATDGMDVKETTEGGLEALDKGAKAPVFEAPKPMMWDSSTGPDSATTVAPQGAATARTMRAAEAAGSEEPGAGDSGKLAPVGVEVSAGGKELVLTPDVGVLKGKDTTYPVFIDPQWYSPRAAAWTMASKYWASSPQWKFNGETNAGLGFCGWDYCMPQDTKRLFYQIPVSTFSGKSILSAEFVVRNVHSASCQARNVELWQTKPISASTTWNSQNAAGFWQKQISWSSFAYGAEGCAAQDAEFDVKGAVQAAANAKWSSFTFGMKVSTETDRYTWKRFSDKAFLRVKYNRPPTQVKTSQLAMEYGGVCSTTVPRVRTLGKIYVNGVTDPDGDNVALQVQAKWDAGDGKGTVTHWGPTLTGYKKSGSNFTLSLPTSIPVNKQVLWHVRSFDGAQYSPWSSDGTPSACYFVYDTSVPKSPTISSGDYPPSDSDNPEDPWYDGVGQYGSFQIKGADTDVTKYWYGFNTNPSSKNAVTTTGGAAKAVNLLPARAGLNFVTAQAFDQAGNGSAPHTYQFRVKGGQPERAAWALDEAGGAIKAEASTPPRVVRLGGDAALGVEGKKGAALHFGGVNGYAVSDIPAVDTSASFSVSTWAKIDKMPTKAAIIATQPGNHVPGFELYYSADLNRWVFNQYTEDKPTGAGIARAMAPVAGDAKAGAWAHLVGVYDEQAKQLRLYVDGKLAGSTAYSTAWEARRGLQLGSGIYNGVRSAFFPGTVDDLQLFDRAVTAAEVTQLHQGAAVTSGRPARAQFPLDEANTAKETIGHAAAQSLTLQGGAVAGEAGIAGRALKLDGATGYAATAGPVLDSARSYSISSWAQLPKGTITGDRTVVSQSGKYYSPFYLSYEEGLKTWVLRTSLADVMDGNVRDQIVVAQQPAVQGEWTHLVAVHDVTAHRIQLYVNGQFQGSAAAPKVWDATGPFQVGRAIWKQTLGDYFTGKIDDVRLFDRPVAEEEAQQLFRQKPALKARWMLDTATGTDSPDDAKQQGALKLQGGASIGAGFMESGMVLDGKAGYADVATMPADTSSSFTVTAWAQASALPDHPVAVLSAEGGARSALDLRFVPDTTEPTGPGHWELVLPDKDAADAALTQVKHSEFSSAADWNHLAVVYDGFAKEARLYVNGVLQDSVCGETPNGAGESECADLASWAQDALTYKAGKSLQIGRAKDGAAWGSYFPGAIDDVWAFQGALNESQVAELAHSWFDLPTEVPAGS